MTKDKRFEELRKVPAFAAFDHRLFLDDQGNDRRLSSLPRKDRRQLKAAGRKIGLKYKKIMQEMRRSGVGYPADHLLREMAFEYTHRYASSGLMNQPVSFNYFEPFCSIRLIEGSVAPYVVPLREIDHLFNVTDYFDYITSGDASEYNLSSLMSLPEHIVHHYTQNGSINDFTYMTSEGREFVISGFSMVRHGQSIHWYIIGGEVLSEEEWNERCENTEELDLDYVAPEKRAFLSESIAKNGADRGAPVPLEGTERAVRTAIAGETDIGLGKHVARCYLSETARSFRVFCDDPEIVSNIHGSVAREEVITQMKSRVDNAAVMWSLAEAFFQIANYFSFRITVPSSAVEASGQPAPRLIKGGRGAGANFKYVTAIEVSDNPKGLVRSYTPSHIPVETEGHWRRLPSDRFGHDMNGNRIQGRTWVKTSNKWRESGNISRTIYIKSSVAAARIKAFEYIQAAENRPVGDTELAGATGVLYVMRCIAMKDDVFKVGWTSGTAEQRAKELSSSTGVPESFVVVDIWRHPDPEALEKGVHALLAPYRLTEGREFFRLRYSELKGIIEGEVARSELHVGQS